MSSVISVKHVTKLFGDLKVLEDVSLDVKKGEFVSIIGPSGCGKTTLLKTVGGLVSPTHGDVELEGMQPVQRRKEGYLGFVSQNPVLLPWRRLLENVRLPLEILHQNGVSKEDITKLLDMLGLAGFENAYPYQLSGGMQQRAALARVFLYKPSLLLMDEPFGSVDEINRIRLNFELLRVWEQFHTTILFVTHNIEEAVLLSDRVVILSPRPSKINDVIPIDLPRPRTAETLNLERFNELSKWTRKKINSISLT